MEEQYEYDTFFEEVSADTLDKYCDGDLIGFYEKVILKVEAKAKRLLDVGCGSGNRVFGFYEQAGIDFLGVERSKNFISGSRQKHKIIESDLCDNEFIPKLNQELAKRNFKNYDTVVLFCGVVNGFIDHDKRTQAWENLQGMLSENTTLVIHSIGDTRWFDTEPEGKCLKLVANGVFPNQYLYSKKELETIFKKQHLQVLKHYVCDFPATTLKHSFYILKKLS